MTEKQSQSAPSGFMSHAVSRAETYESPTYSISIYGFGLISEAVIVENKNTSHSFVILNKESCAFIDLYLARHRAEDKEVESVAFIYGLYAPHHFPF